ncbi:hypothetical protein RhiirA4_487542 [Rhizophagus irregularis]|uniref:Uncharacterized protein n=1 Tax=Rhizophagus irregularis TaxID=588596 RepID=A0A2I1HSP2_9GLOM|nr:hypothetical protein RhiirA4_487542 [Rhizophagus irregularis]
MRTLDTLFTSTEVSTIYKKSTNTSKRNKSAKTNKNVFTYDYLRRLSIHRYIQLLLDGRSKMDASNQIAQTMWDKCDYITRCIRK